MCVFVCFCLFFVYFLFFALFCLLVCLVFFGVVFHAMVFIGLVSTRLLLVLSTAGGLDFISKTFSLCKPIEDKYALSDMLDWLAGIYSNLAMVDYPYAASFLEPLPAWPVKVPVIRYCQPGLSRYLSLFTESVGAVKQCCASFCTCSLLPAWYICYWICWSCEAVLCFFLFVNFLLSSMIPWGIWSHESVTHEILGSTVVCIPACHTGDQGSFPCQMWSFPCFITVNKITIRLHWRLHATEGRLVLIL